ncbi:hypothetical protein GOB94_08605 [Granulicella sp. 5B5]|uniref:hypothetical protein n=1 Tax=Granulicella sp. 5B5 TaxID=1617967 RepID=UPI0015F4CB99|nr:hypothetical protein [Granulicella sp. 5B5]QMV18735.1 hypothetical protein GOB94_08605 [Granulicella sp. 5B5]
MLAAWLHAQQPASGDRLADVLVHLGAQATALDRSLPSFTCLQKANSDELREGRHDQPAKVLRHVEFTANLRVRRLADGKLAESAEFLTVNGKPFDANGFTMPAYAQGGFLQAVSYFLPDQQRCYVYTLAGNRVDFTAAPNAAADSHCRSAGTTGFALLDDDGNLKHIERNVSAYGAAVYHLIPHAEVDMVPVTLNGVTYPLSSHLVSERPNGRFLDRFESRYTGCKLFTATVIIGPVTSMPEVPK